MTKLPHSGTEFLNKKDIRIAFIKNPGDFKISSFKVYDCKSQKERDFLHSYLQGIIYSDWGNSHGDWEEWDLTDILLNILEKDVVSYKVTEEIFKELGKVKEWKDRLASYNDYYWENS